CKIISKLEKINLFKSQKEFSIDNYLEEFRNVSFVWKIFLLHTIRPNDYPIYDQNVHRAFAMINGDLYDKITSSMSDKQKSNFYFKDYVPFFQAVDRHQRIDFDKAFFAFGQFLNTGNYDGFF
ncbi:MAG: hypothetical protein KAH48_02260, partial [Chlorobi bacterium]|nr:hypothetical protein [Chlorobiota bacterium]